MLSPDQARQRVGRLTASRVACLMTGDADKIMNLWREMVGDPDFVPDDLSDVWAVQLGSHTEPLNLDWYERRTGRTLSRRGEVVVHPDGWAAATLDAWDNNLSAPVECKHVGGFEKTSTIIERYMPQAHWQMIVTGALRCAFSIIEGAKEPVVEIVNHDAAYASELWSRACAFMICVNTLTPPVALPPVASPVKPERIVDMTGSNVWAANAATWITTRAAAKDHAAATTELKSLVPADAKIADGHGISISRNKAGSLTIKERD